MEVISCHDQNVHDVLTKDEGGDNFISTFMKYDGTINKKCLTSTLVCDVVTIVDTPKRCSKARVRTSWILLSLLSYSNWTIVLVLVRKYHVQEVF